MSEATKVETKMPVVEVYQDQDLKRLAEGDEAADVEPRAVPSWTFRIDGQESMLRCPTKYAAERVVDRLRRGMSRAVNGGSGVTSSGAVAGSQGAAKLVRGKVEPAGEVTTETVTTKSGRKKPREKRPGFLYVLDGAEQPVKVPTETEAKTLLAFHAFRTRGKLNPAWAGAAQASFRDQHKKDCRVHQVGRRLFAKDEVGLLWSVYRDDQAGDYKFKLLGK